MLPNPLRPRAFGGKGADGLKKEITSSNFSLYEDRVSGNPIVIMGEQQATEAWSDPTFISNGYRYEICVD